MQIFSPNMLKTFEECQKKYEFRYIQKLSVPIETKVFEKGKKIHALAHYYLRGDDITKMINALTEEELVVWHSLLNNEYFQKQYVNSEYNINCRVGNYWIGGRLDAFMKTDNNYYILDYKTGSVPKNPEIDFQTIIYLLCANAILQKGWGNNFSLNFVYIDLKNKRNLVIQYDEPKQKDYTKKIIETCDKITKTLDFQKNYSACKYCEYNKICKIH